MRSLRPLSYFQETRYTRHKRPANHFHKNLQHIIAYFTPALTDVDYEAIQNSMALVLGLMNLS